MIHGNCVNPHLAMGSTSSKSRDFSNAGPTELLKALRLLSSPDSRWGDADLKDMLQHALDAPLAPEVGQALGEAFTERVRQLSTTSLPAIANLRDLVSHPNPPADLLSLVKDFAKISAEHPTHPLPRDLAKVLYYTAILVARRHGLTISAQDDAAIQRATRWAMELSWLDDTVRQVFASATV